MILAKNSKELFARNKKFLSELISEHFSPELAYNNNYKTWKNDPYPVKKFSKSTIKKWIKEITNNEQNINEEFI